MIPCQHTPRHSPTAQFRRPAALHTTSVMSASAGTTIRLAPCHEPYRRAEVQISV